MTFQLSDPAEAYISLILAVTTLDGDFSPTEFRASHTFLDSLPAFQRHDDETLANFWIDMTRNFFEEFSSNGQLGPRDVEDLIGAVKMILPANQYDMAYAAAVETAVADGIKEREQRFLSQLQRAFHISDNDAQSILAHVQGH